MEGMKYHLLPQRRPLLQSPRTRPRKATVGAMFAVGGMDATKGRAITCLLIAVQKHVAFFRLGSELRRLVALKISSTFLNT